MKYALLLASLFLASQVLAQVSVDASQKTMDQIAGHPDFDIRQQVRPSLQAPSDLYAQRSAAMRALAAPARPEAPPRFRVVLNEFGLPKLWYREGGAMSEPRTGDPATVAHDFLRNFSSVLHLDGGDIESLGLTRGEAAEGLVFLRFQQSWGGLPVYGGDVRVVVDQQGRIVHVGAGELIPSMTGAVRPGLAAREAVMSAYRSLGSQAPRLLPARAPAAAGQVRFLNPKGADYSHITAELCWFPMTPVTARLAYHIFLELDKTAWFEILIDADTGQLLFRHNLYVFAGQGRVWRQSPMKGARELVNLPDAWLRSNAVVTTGNNVDAYVDWNGNDSPDDVSIGDLRDGRAYSQGQVFDFPAGEGTTGQDPRGFRAASVTNLFYLVNLAHDYYYGLGFNEAAGNFQTDNLGRGGVGNDAIRAEAQFGGFRNNAAIAPTPEGTAPRLRMGLFTRGTSSLTDDLDSDYEGQVVFHEYAHGVTARIIGGGTNMSCLHGPQSGALAEGWSDYFSDSFFSDPVQGAYLTQNAVHGVRRQSYDGYTFTYEDLGNDEYEVHLDGEIWGATLWDLRKLLGPAATDKLVYNGLRFTPCRPTMVDARDGILAADQTINGGANRPRLWQVFARHGMGFAASGVDIGASGATIHNAAFDQPPDLQPGNKSPKITSLPPTPPGMGTPYTYDVDASDPDGDTLRYELTQGPSGMTIDSASGALRWASPTFVGVRVKITVTDGRGGRTVHGFFLKVDTPLSLDTPVIVEGATGSSGFAHFTIPAGALVAQVTLRNGTGDADLTATGPDGVIAGGSYRDGTTETLTLPVPEAGLWTIVVGGYRAYSGVSFMVSLPVPTVMGGNATKTGLSGDLSSETFFRVSIPAGATSFKVSTTGGSGDVDLFVRQGKVPDCQVVRISIERKMGSGSACGEGYSVGFDSNEESITFSGPDAGDWFIDLSASAAYSGVMLTTQLSIPPTLTLNSGVLSFSSIEGGPAPPAQSLMISNASGGPFTWAAQAATSSGGNWLRLDKASGAGEGTVSVSVSPGNLTAGAYRGTITVTADLLGRSPQIVQVTLTITAKPVIALSAPKLTFFALRGQDPPPQTLLISNSGGSTLNWTAAATTSSGGNWLSISPTTGAGEVTLQVAVRADSLAEGDYNGTIRFTAIGAANPASVSVSLTVGVPVVLSGDGVVNAAAYAPNRAVAVNEIVSLFGSNFTEPCSLAGGSATPCPAAKSFPLPTQLGATRVTFNGVLAPLLLVTATQINLVVPFGLTGPTATIVATRGSISNPPVTVPLAPQSLGVFTVLGSGAGAAVLLHADGRLVARDTPIEPDEVLIIYATGLGDVNSAPATGSAAPADPLSQTVARIQVFFDGGEGQVLFSGLTPGFAGLYQLNVKAPSFLARRFPVVRLQNTVSLSNETSAGGPSLLDVSPANARVNSDLTVTLRGINLAPNMRLRVGGEDLAISMQDGLLQAMTATIPGRLLNRPGDVSLAVVDPAASGEAPSNAVHLTLAP